MSRMTLDPGRCGGINRFVAGIHYLEREQVFVLCISMSTMAMRESWRVVTIPVAAREDVERAYAQAHQRLEEDFRRRGLDLPWPMLTAEEMTSLWDQDGVIYDREECSPVGDQLLGGLGS